VGVEAESDSRILTLFEGAGTIETATPSARAWLARDTTGERRAVMIKRVPETRQSRATEALHLYHPNIVRTRRWLRDTGGLYVVRDVVKGKNLRQTLAGLGGARPTPELLRKIITPLLDTLVYAHGQNVPHGGVSPDNILIADDGGIWLSDFATTDPAAPQHYSTYQGKTMVQGDVKALGRVLSAYLPTTGAFSSPAVRGRIEGIISRCDTLEDLRVTLNALERFAIAPTPQPMPTTGKAPAGNTPTQAIPAQTAPAQTAPAQTAPAGTNTGTESASRTPPPTPQRPGPPPLEIPGAGTRGTDPNPTVPALLLSVAERSIRIPQGGGGFATIIARNEAKAPLVIRMIATQHAWLNLREPLMPLTITQNGVERIGFNISAARLTPGDYRSEVYLLANGDGIGAEKQSGGWYKHTIEIVVTVEPAIGSGTARTRFR